MEPSEDTPKPLGALAQIGQFFFSVFKYVDDLPLEDKQPIKEAFAACFSADPRLRATAKLLTHQDDELRRVLSGAGWLVLPRDINGPIKRELLTLGRQGNPSLIDSYLCSLFNGENTSKLQGKIESWFALPYLNDRRQIILDAAAAHTSRKWTLSIPALFPLVDGLTRRFRRERLRPGKKSAGAMQVGRVAGYYRRKEPKLFGVSLDDFVRKYLYATFDFNEGNPPSSINRHGILHGEIPDYATEANSLRVILLLDTIAQFIRAFEEKRRKQRTRVPSGQKRMDTPKR